MTNGDEKNRGKWKSELLRIFSWGKDDTITSIRTRTRKSITEQPIQQLNPTELHSHSKTTTSNIQDNKTLNVNAEEYRPKKSGAAVTK